jgi:uncharacterized lipoprotein YddW (UPF0748 family)
VPAIPAPEPQDRPQLLDIPTGETRDRPQVPNFPSRDLPRQSEDPADQIAPPGLNVRRGNEPISPFLAVRMQQELDNLVGRFESAMLGVAAADQPTEVQLPTLQASVVSAAPKVDLAEAEPTLHPVLVEARQLSQEWTDLIAKQAYREARDRWLAVRQDLWENFPLDRPFGQPEIRAMWLDRGTIVRARTPAGLAALFDKMQAAGINTVFLETVNAGYPIYPTRVAPSQNPLTQKWDCLAAAVDLAHERNMELHAWMWTFAAGNQRHNVILNLPSNYLGPSINLHPDWAGFDNEGNPIPRGQTKPFYDPANPDVREYLLRLVDEIITNYDVDGLQLDYIRYPFQDPGAGRTYGYGLAARRQFRRLTGVDPLELSPRVDPWLPRAQRERLRSLWEQWNEFRIQQITSFVEETSALVRSKRPGITLSTAVFAMSEHERLLKIQQDWNTWAENGLVDWIVLMSYAQDTNRFAELINPWVLDQAYESTLVIPGIRLLNLPIPAMIDQLQALRDLPAPGYALFATDNLDNRVQTVLNNTQGTHAGQVPQAAPYQTAAERFKALQREWNWLLTNGQMVLQPKLADSWAEEINAVGSSLNALANQTPGTTVETVQAQVETLKRNLNVGMRLQTATTPEYRLRAWENRLEAIRRYLAYGAVQLSS